MSRTFFAPPQTIDPAALGIPELQVNNSRFATLDVAALAAKLFDNSRRLAGA